MTTSICPGSSATGVLPAGKQLVIAFDGSTTCFFTLTADENTLVHEELDAETTFGPFLSNCDYRVDCITGRTNITIVDYTDPVLEFGVTPDDPIVIPTVGTLTFTNGILTSFEPAA